MADVLRVRPRPGDVARLGSERARLAAVVRLANCVVFACALAAALVRMVPPTAGEESFGHWPAGQRDLVVVDRTGDAGWHQATRHAVEVWNRSGADLRLSWRTGEGPCDHDGAIISVCEVSAERLDGILQFEGVADQDTDDDGHARSAVLQVCDGCGLDDGLRRVVATHELGHALGLRHNERLGSVLYPVGGTDRPDADDYDELRRLHAHTD